MDRARLLAEAAEKGDKLKEAQRLEMNAEGYVEAAEFETAIAEFDKARTAYNGLIAPGKSATLEEAVAARTAMLSARKQVKGLAAPTGDNKAEDSDKLLREFVKRKATAKTGTDTAEGKGPRKGSLPDLLAKASSAETGATDAMAGREYTPGKALFNQAEKLYQQVAALQAKIESASASKKAVEDSLKLADQAFKSDGRPASFERGKQALEDGSKALADEELDKAKGMFAAATEAFAKAQSEAAAANDFAAAQEEWAKTMSGADEEALGKHAQSDWNAAKKKAEGAEAKAKDGDLASATGEMKVATEAFKAACGKALTAENTAKASPVIARLEEAIKKKDKFLSEDILAELEKMIPQDARMAGLRSQVAAVPGPKKNLSVDLGGGVNLELVLIRPGTFMMGDKDAKAHKVSLTKPFYMGKYEVTQEQWKAVVGDNPSNFKDGADAGKRPVEQVSWNDINEKFLPKLAERISKGSTPRLPTEAEWEYCCRAGTTGDYAGELDAMGWYDGNSGKTTHPVGGKKANAWGLYDMHGNVWEWCKDWYGEYSGSDVSDPAGASTGSPRVLRGGSWCRDAGGCRAAYRYSLYVPEFRNYFYGFRVVISVP